MISTASKQPFRVDRTSQGGVVIRLGDLGLYMEMEDLHDLNNEIAAMLHDWYEERDRNGRA